MNDERNLYANGSKRYLGRPTTFPTEIEEELVNHIVKLESMFFGMTRRDLMRLAYQLAEKNGIQHHFNENVQSAGKQWFKKFMNLHPELSLRQPEATSLARASGFRKELGYKFYDHLQQIIDEHHLDATKI